MYFCLYVPLPSPLYSLYIQLYDICACPFLVRVRVRVRVRRLFHGEKTGREKLRPKQRRPGRQIDKDRTRVSERQRLAHTHTQTDRQTDRQTEKAKKKQRDRHTDYY